VSTGSVRPAEPADVPHIVAMVHELATYERAPESCHLTASDLAAALFGERPALFGHVALDATGEPVGFALWFLNFSTWEGRHGIYLEDLYVRPTARGSGLGHALLAELARICVARDYRRLEWWVLDWNEAAHAFYRRAGARPMADWTVWRLDGDALTHLGSDTEAIDPTH
jgi:GNAT superfamily N-acetyltransferase